MNNSLRALTAAFVIAVASLAGALYLAHAHGGATNESYLGSPGTGVAALDLHALLDATGNPDQRMLDNAFRQVEKAYYRPVNAQILLNGEQHELLAYLRGHKVSSPSIPAAVATGDESHDLTLLNKNLEIAESEYGKQASNVELTQTAIRGMLNALGDPYTTYLSPSEINSLEESLKGGQFGGIGVYIVEDVQKRVLVEPIEGTPAYRAGIKTGDRILAVDAHPVTGMKLDSVERLIRGPIGTIVRLRVTSSAGTNERTVPVTRQEIKVPSVYAKIEDGFEYVRLAEFGQTSADEVRQAMLHGKHALARGYILDLRNNGGGYLDAAVAISSLFVQQGPIVSTIDRGGTRETKDALQDAIGTTPLVVLVNKYTASASEITAGAIQDYKIGPLIGTKTFGKGVVQSIYSMSDGGALKITTARYVTPLGRDIQHRGILPDIVIDQPIGPSIIDSPKDLQLAAAKKYLRGIASR